MNIEKLKLILDLGASAERALVAIDDLRKQEPSKVLVGGFWADKHRVISFLLEEIRFIEEQLKTLGVEL